jgi:hypothetical protein
MLQWACANHKQLASTTYTYVGMLLSWLAKHHSSQAAGADGLNVPVRAISRLGALRCISISVLLLPEYRAA